MDLFALRNNTINYIIKFNKMNLNCVGIYIYKNEICYVHDQCPPRLLESLYRAQNLLVKLYGYFMIPPDPNLW